MKITEDKYPDGIKRVLITEDEIRAEVEKAGCLIDSWYDGNPILLVGILNGSFVFLADLCRHISVPCEIGFMAAESYYSGTSSTGNVKITLDLRRNLKDYNVVIAEDIIDTGRTLHEITKILKSREPKSLRVVTLLDKPERRAVPFKPDYSLFTVPNLFVIGYGLDYDGKYRNLPFIAEIEQ